MRSVTLPGITPVRTPPKCAICGRPTPLESALIETDLILCPRCASDDASPPPAVRDGAFVKLDRMCTWCPRQASAIRLGTPSGDAPLCFECDAAYANGLATRPQTSSGSRTAGLDAAITETLLVMLMEKSRPPTTEWTAISERRGKALTNLATQLLSMLTDNTSLRALGPSLLRQVALDSAVGILDAIATAAASRIGTKGRLGHT